MKTRLEFMNEFREATLELVIQRDIEIEHGNRMLQFYEGKKNEIIEKAESMEKKERYDFEKQELKPAKHMIEVVSKEVIAKQTDIANRRVAVGILEGMIQEEELRLKAEAEGNDPEKVGEAKKDFDNETQQ